MKITVPYGKGEISAQVGEGIRVHVVAPETKPLGGSDADRVEAALDAPIGTARLEELVKPDQRVLIVVNDHTRPGPNREIVQGVLGRLHKAGVPDKNIRFICATGSHRAPTDAELRTIIGDGPADTYEVVMHNCKDKEHLFRLGDVNGLDVWLNTAVREADFIITTGLIALTTPPASPAGARASCPASPGWRRCTCITPCPCGLMTPPWAS